MDATLILLTPDGSQREIALKKFPAVVGRQTDVTIRVPSDAVSRRHCEITLAADKLSVKDLGSANGTYVNRRPIHEADLHAGDVLTVGPAVFVVRLDGQPASIDAQKVLSSINTPPAAKGKPTAPTKIIDAKSVDPANAPKPKGKTDDDIDLDALIGDADLDDSSAFDFDFKDDKDAPKL